MVTELITVPSGEVSANWRTPYTTAAINEQMRLLPKGIVRGFYPTPTAATNDSITLITDNVIADSLMQAVSSGYALTYRTGSSVVLGLTNPTSGPTVAARVYVYLVPSYSVGNDTTVKWRQYTEAEFEAGTPSSDGGLFVCAVSLGASPAQLSHYDIMLSGVSQSSETVFVQDRAKFHKNGSGEDHEVVVFSEHFSNMCHSTVIHPDLTAATHTASITASEFDTGGFSLSVSSTGAGSTSFLLGQYPITQFLSNASTIPPRVRVSFTFKTVGGYATAADTDGVVLTFWGDPNGFETTIQMKAAGEAPGFVTLPIAGSTGWKTMTYDVAVPAVATASDSVKSFTAAFNVNHTAGTIYIDRVTVALISEDGKGVYDKASYNMPIQSNTPISATQLIFPPGPQSSYGDFALYRSGLDLSLLYNKVSANADFQLGTNSYPVNLKVEGDGTNTVVALDGAHLETNRYVQSPVYRAPSGATKVEFLNSGGSGESRVKAGSLEVSGRYVGRLHVDPSDLYANLALLVTVGGHTVNVQPMINAETDAEFPVLRIKNNVQSDASGKRGGAIVFTGKNAAGTTINQAILEVSKLLGTEEYPAVRLRGYNGVDTDDMPTTMISSHTRAATAGASELARVGVGLYSPDPGGPFSVQCGGVTGVAFLSSAGVWTDASSDRRAKKDVEDVPYGLEQVLALQPRRFKWKNGGEHVLGFIAQEVEPILPEVVVEKSDGMYTMHHKDIIAVLTKAIQEQQQTIEDLRARIEALEGLS